jgi:hypothetical protein
VLAPLAGVITMKMVASLSLHDLGTIGSTALPLDVLVHAGDRGTRPLLLNDQQEALWHHTLEVKLPVRLEVLPQRAS